MNTHWRTTSAVLVDLLCIAAAWWASYWLRFNLEVPDQESRTMLEAAALVLPVHVFTFWVFHLYRTVWKYTTLVDLQHIVYAVVTGAIAVSAGLYMVYLSPAVPRSVLLLYPLLLLVLTGGVRVAVRIWTERALGLSGDNLEPVLVIGAGQAGVMLIRELSRSNQWKVAGFLDDDPAKLNRLINRVRVLGTIDELPRWSERLSIKRAIIAMPSAPHRARRRAASICASAGVAALMVPSYDDIVSGKVTISQIRNVELEDLLGRDPVALDSAGLRGWLHGRTVMVTGAGGSIGAELCRQLARFEPTRLVFYELGEFAMYLLEQEFLRDFPGTKISAAMGDVKNPARLAQIMQEHRPAVVFHAAAYKHVPLMEHGNAWEAVRNNVLGTLNAARAAIDHGVEKFVLVSTDKAVNPTNVMGATKRLAERVCQSMQKSETSFVTVRFGNVLGSAGSVVPKFRQQIAQGGPVTVTHPEITRYFMSIPEAAQLVLQAGWMGKGGEIFVLEMGEPVKIVDLARDMIRLSGFGEDEIKIEFTGLRPGEKLFEELLSDKERTLPTPHAKLRIAKADGAPGDDWLADLERWLLRRDCPGDDEVRAELSRRVAEYRPAG